MMRGLRSVAVVCVLLGLWNAFTPPLKSGWSTARDQSLVARKADSSGLTPFGPVVTYAKALMEGGKSKGEEVAVTKDVLYIKLMYDSDEFKENLVAVLNNPKLKELEKAETMVKLMPGLKSSVMPKFITFLAKKNRLGGVKRIMLEFVQAMYFNNAITPVKVTSAQRLSDEQKDKIKEKMAAEGSDATEDGSNSQLNETTKEFLTRPATVEQINIEGYWRTKRDILIPGIKRLLKATTFSELVELALEAKEDLMSLGVFHDVDMLIDTSADHSINPNGYDVTFHVKEKRLLTSSTGTQIGNNEGNMMFGCSLNNVFGRAEQVKADLSFGTRTRMSYQLAFIKPTPGTPGRNFTIAAQKSTTDIPFCSHWEATQGLSMDYMFPSIVGQHCVSWEGTWREVTGLAKNASFAIREQAGHSIKSALKHTVIMDKRNNIALPTNGYFIKLAQEFAGLGGDVMFLKHNFEYQQSVEPLKDVILSWSFQGGSLHPLFNTPSKISDRLFLGGPLSVRGFNSKGIGPRSENDSLGADAYWAAGLHVYTPLPFRPGRGGLGDRIKTHLFVNTGNLITLDTNLPWRSRFNSLREKIRWSCGAGLVFMLGIARVELNYCFPIAAQNTDSVNHGIQVGVGINFL